MIASRLFRHPQRARLLFRLSRGGAAAVLPDPTRSASGVWLGFNRRPDRRSAHVIGVDTTSSCADSVFRLSVFILSSTTRWSERGPKFALSLACLVLNKNSPSKSFVRRQSCCCRSSFPPCCLHRVLVDHDSQSRSWTGRCQTNWASWPVTTPLFLGEPNLARGDHHRQHLARLPCRRHLLCGGLQTIAP